jgi:hypothetical protein
MRGQYVSAKSVNSFSHSSIFAAILAPFAGAQQIHELYYNGSKRTDQALNSGAANWFSGMAGFYTTPNDQFHVYYRVLGDRATIPMCISFFITE